jgi:hypothetical protein
MTVRRQAFDCRRSLISASDGLTQGGRVKTRGARTGNLPRGCFYAAANDRRPTWLSYAWDAGNAFVKPGILMTRLKSQVRTCRLTSVETCLRLFICRRSMPSCPVPAGRSSQPQLQHYSAARPLLCAICRENFFCLRRRQKRDEPLSRIAL